MRREFSEYVDRMNKIRILSTPKLDEIKTEEDYGRILVSSFRQIGDLAAKNREVVEGILLPLLHSEGPLSSEEKAELSELNELLVDYHTTNEIDQHISDMINERLMNEEPDPDEPGDDTDSRIRSIVKTMQIKYFRMITTQHSNYVSSEKSRAEGLAAFDKLKVYLDKSSFSNLTDVTRKLVFYNSINGALLYQAYAGENRAFYRKKMMEELKEVLCRVNDDYYRNLMPDVDWYGYEYRVYDHMSAILIDPELPEEEAREIYPYMLRAKEIYENVVNKTQSLDDLTLTLFEASAMAGVPDVEEHFEEMIRIYRKRDKKDYSRRGGQFNQCYPLTVYECLATGKVHKLTQRDYALMESMVRNMIEYIGETPKDLLLADRVVMQCKLMNVYMETPGSITFGELCMESIAAIHPPTYVHSNMVARISECLARHLIDKKPEVFVGYPGVKEPGQVQGMRDEILNYTYNAALYHDIGKLSIIDTIGMYGRRLLDSEFFNVKQHPDNGYKIAVKFNSTREYADVIRGHHRFYDNSKGYPEDFDTSKSPYKTIIDIVTVADCMDAATDSVGRSYNSGKTFDDFKKEAVEGAGTRYASYFPELFDDPEVLADIEYLLTEERSWIYRKIYRVLKRYSESQMGI